MEQQRDFNKYKITSVSTQTCILNVFMDSFTIDKVKFEIVKYETKERIQCYMDFDDVLLLQEKISFNQLFKTEPQVNVHRGGTTKSKDTGKPVSRTMDFNLSDKWVFVKMAQGEGRLSDTGAIMPNGTPTLTLNIRVSYEDLRKLFLIVKSYIEAYLPGKVHRLIKEHQEEVRNLNQ